MYSDYPGFAPLSCTCYYFAEALKLNEIFAYTGT